MRYMPADRTLYLPSQQSEIRPMMGYVANIIEYLTSVLSFQESLQQEKKERAVKVFQMIIIFALFSVISGSLYFILSGQAALLQ